MSEDSLQPEEAAELRHRAEKRLTRLPTDGQDPGTAAETQRLVHELQVHQIELEMQNQELRESRLKAETALARYTDLYDFAPVGYVTLSTGGLIQELNLPGARLLGLERSKLLGSAFRNFVSADTRPIFDSWLRNLFATRAKHACLVTLQNGEGQTAVEIEATLSLDESEGRAVVVDVTERKALEEKLQQAQKMEIIGQLAGGVAHEFNNIVAASLLNLEMLQMQRDLPAPILSSLKELEDLAKRAGSLTRKLLLFSRRQPMQTVPLNVNATIKDTYEMLERLLDENITSRWLPSPNELWIEGDPIMLDQAVMNLCLNAKEAMASGGILTLETSLVEFSVETAQAHREYRPGKFVCLKISDTGVGMEPTILKHLFEPFFTTKGVGEATGMGLAATYGIVQQHKGWISVDSVLGHGSSFFIYLPLSERTGLGSRTIAPLSSLKGHNETILLVEDEPSLLFVNTRALIMFGYQVLTAKNGPEALALWDEVREKVDLLLTDMQMPNGVTGLELAQKLQATKAGLKVVIMSGYSLEIVRKCASDHPDFAFLAKPFSLQTLSETVHRCFEHSQ